MFKFRKLRCSFCGRDETQVAKLVAGPRVYICDSCVTVASRIMNSDGDASATVEPTLFGKLMTRIRGLLHNPKAHLNSVRLA